LAQDYTWLDTDPETGVFLDEDGELNDYQVLEFGVGATTS
jgi:hypothetical protein